MIELMVAVAIAVILMSVGAPSMVQAMRTQEVRAVRDELMGALHLAEIEAARRGVPVMLVRQTGCAVSLAGTSDWSCGYLLFSDNNSNGLQDATEASIKVFSVTAKVQLNRVAGGADSLTMNQWGRAAGGGQRFEVSPRNASGGRFTVCLNAGGRVHQLAGSVTCP